jgi:hypothetical protein
MESLRRSKIGWFKQFHPLQVDKAPLVLNQPGLLVKK